ncbi:hypothetical protein GOODEAATRI_026009, partial [Goodea atripinnis]
PASAKRQSSILFMCDHSAGHGNPQLLTETAGCSTTFQWRTNVVCPPKKMECKLVRQHQTFDLRSLSSLTEAWKFSSQGYSYYVNLCQGIHGGLSSSPEGATVCRRSAAGQTQTLGRVYTQKMSYADGKIVVSYSAGDDVCGNGVNAKTVIQLSCGSTVGHPSLLSPHQASGDIRPNGDRYIYHIQLSGITNPSLPKCRGANICQVNTDGGEEEMEWLMEELEAPLSSSSHRVTSNHSNGHIRTKPVNTDGLHSFSLDEQDDDSEDEVLSVPGVRVLKPSGVSRTHRSAFLQVGDSPALIQVSLLPFEWSVCRGRLSIQISCLEQKSPLFALMATFDDILEEAGKFGRFQKRIFALLCMVSMPWAGVYVGIVFQGFTPDHWCRDSAAVERREACGWSREESRRLTAPLVNISRILQHSSCERYEVDWNVTELRCDPQEPDQSRTPTVRCTEGWEYDYEGRRSFVTEVRKVRVLTEARMKKLWVLFFSRSR